MSHKDIVILGMMVFALFLGAGNIIFPPMEGYHAGTDWVVAASGFVLTGVLMPFITLVVVAILGRGEELSRDLPKWAEVLFWSILYLTIGATFAMPRVINVTYEMAFLPLGNFEDTTTTHFVFTLIFVLIGLACVLRPSTIINSVGQFMTPLLLVLLTIVGVSVYLMPLSEILPPSQTYTTNSAVAIGAVSGYQTMDLLAATAFGGIVARALAVRGVTSGKKIAIYTIGAGLLSVIMLGALYFSLFYLGATSDLVAKDATNGGQIFSKYIAELFGPAGTWMMAAIVILANLTTLVGLLNASADYFSKLIPRFNYATWTVILSALTLYVSMAGLTMLLKVTIPALMLIYPIAIMFVVLQFFRCKMGNIKLTYYTTLLVALLFGLMDSVKQLVGFEVFSDTTVQAIKQLDTFLDVVPLYSQGIGWLVPCLVVMLLTTFLAPKKA